MKVLKREIEYKGGGKVKSKVNEAGNYTKPGMRKRIFKRIMAQMLAKAYKAAGGGYKS